MNGKTCLACGAYAIPVHEITKNGTHRGCGGYCRTPRYDYSKDERIAELEAENKRLREAISALECVGHACAAKREDGDAYCD